MKSLYYAANKLTTTFAQCSIAVENIVLSALHANICLWCKYTQSCIQGLHVAYNNAYQILHYISRNVSVPPH